MSLANNNPVNIIYDGTNWLGLANPPNDGRFCVFADMIHGLRAAMINLRNYQVLHGINTIEGVIERHAPPCENPTGNYIHYVSMRTNFVADEELDFSKRAFSIPVIRAMTEFENNPANVKIDPEVYQHAADMAALG